MHIAKCSLCMLTEKEVAPFVLSLGCEEVKIVPEAGMTHLVFQGKKPVAPFIEQVREKFPTFFYGEGAIAEAVHREFIARKKTLALAESCSGGQMAAALTAIPDASQFLLGSIVAYSNQWKERFLQVSHTTLKKQSAVSREVVVEMVQGLFGETDADYAVAVSGFAGPGGGTKEKPVGTIYVAIGQRGKKIDAGVIHAPPDRGRSYAIDLTVQLALGALWRALVHNTPSFS